MDVGSDYWNLGTGSEIGLYQQSVESRTHYDAVDFLCPMQLSTYKYSNGQVYGSYYNWNPIYNKQCGLLHLIGDIRNQILKNW